MPSNNFNPIDGGFLQSNQWEKFQNEVGKKTFRINEGGLTCLAVQNNLPIVGDYFFIPRGPVKLTENPLKIENFLNQLTETAGKNNIGWIRFEPQSFKDLEEIKKALSGKYKIKKSKKDHEPVQMLMLDLSQSEEEILAAMKPKTRYNIKLSEKKGVKIYASKKKEAVDIFLNLMDETAKREGIVSHPRNYYQKMVEIIPDNFAQLILAEFENRIIAGAIIIFYGEVAAYLHGASSNEMRNLMAPFGVQWAAIKIAKEKGYKKYDFGGVSVETGICQKVKKNWEGITRFKTGFCPSNTPVEFPGCWDIVLDNKKYWAYRILQGIKDLIKFG